MPKKFVLTINEFEKELFDHAIQVLVDQQNTMGSITPAMAADLEKMADKIEERGEYATGI